VQFLDLGELTRNQDLVGRFGAIRSTLATDIGPARARWVALQHTLIDLLDFLDESAVRFPRHLHSKIPDGVD
jgi:hypothetical protein